MRSGFGSVPGIFLAHRSAAPIALWWAEEALLVRTTLFLSLTLAGFCAVVVSAQTVQPLDVKTGEWETTMIQQGLGAIMASAMPPGMLDKMPPEQRAKMEERMKAMSGAQTTVTKSCITKEKLAQAFDPGANQRQQCKRTVVISTSIRQEATITCESDKAKSTGKMTLEAIDSTHIKGSMQVAVAMAKGPSDINFSFTSKWLGPVCSEDKKGAN